MELKQNKVYEVYLKDGTSFVGYFYDKDKKCLFLSPFNHLNDSFGLPRKDIKKIIELDEIK